MEIDIPDTVWFESDQIMPPFPGAYGERRKRLCFTHAVKAVMLEAAQVEARISAHADYSSCDVCYDDYDR